MAESCQVQIQGIDIRQRVIGDGPPIVMVHGWGASIELLQPLALRLSRLGYRCHMFDLPGFGESVEPPRPWSIFDYAEFVIAYMDDQSLETARYFGHSLGGRIGLILGAKHAERIDKMALSNSAGIKVAPATAARLRLRLYQHIRDGLRILGAKAISDRLRQAYNQRFGSEDYLNASPIMRQTLVNVVNQDLLDYAQRVAVPTILLWGDQDRDTPLWMGRRLERAIPDAALISREKAGHYAYLDFLDDSAAIINSLFRAE